jgi:hypothetical protein
MMHVHIIPTGEQPEHHTLTNCPCSPVRRRIRIGDVYDWVSIHRVAADDLDTPVMVKS